MVLPLLELLFEVAGLWLDPRPELFQCGALGPLDFSVKLRRPRFVGPKLDRPVEKSPLHFSVEEFAAAIGLNPLDREGHLLGDFIEEMQGICPSAAREQPDHDIAATIIHWGVLITAKPDLADIHLHPVARNRSAITPAVMAVQAPLRKTVEFEAQERPDGPWQRIIASHAPAAIHCAAVCCQVQSRNCRAWRR